LAPRSGKLAVLGDEDAMVAALKETYGPFADVMDIERIVSVILDPRNPPGDSQRYFFNQPTSAIDSYIAAPSWARCQDESLKLAPGDVITLGFDGSRGKKARGKPDATGLVATRLSDGYQAVLGHWEAEEVPGMETWEPPVVEIDATIRDAFKTYRVAAFYADPPGWREYINVWERDLSPKLAKASSGRQVKVKADHPFEWWMVGTRGELVQRAVEAYEDAVVGAVMKHDGNVNLTRHVLNARRRLRHSKLTLAKEHDYSPKKIDLCVCAVLSWQAYLDAIAAGVGAKRKSRAPVRLQ
jgi:hypothetical protein